MTDLLEICVYSLAKLNKDKIKQPSVFMSFNQNPGSATKETFATQIKEIINNIVDGSHGSDPDLQEAAKILDFKEKADKIQVLSNAFAKENPTTDSDFFMEVILPAFTIECKNFLKSIIEVINNTKDENYSVFDEWIEMAKQVWNTLGNT
jgi:hypothetical protein